MLVEQEGTLEFLLHRRRDRLEFAVSNVAHCAEVWGLDVGNVVLGAVHGELVGDRHAVQNGRNGKSMANFSVPYDFFTHMPGTIEVMVLVWWVNMPPCWPSYELSVFFTQTRSTACSTVPSQNGQTWPYFFPRASTAPN